MRITVTILFSGYSTIPCAPACFKRGMISRTVVSSRIVFTASHSSSLRCEMVGRLSAGRTPAPSQIVLVHVQHQPHFAQRVDGAFEQHLDVLQLAAFAASCHDIAVGDQLRVRFEHGIDDLEVVRA